MPQPPVAILGAGINGCALARELLLSGVPVTLVDTADVAYGATAYSSRLIHGGLRYLEYGEFDLVRESLAERTRLLRLAPQFVHPLQLFIPTGSRWGGMCAAIGRFFGWGWWPVPAGGRRGLMLVRAGLMLYDAYARDPTLPRHQIVSAASAAAVPVDPAQFRWLAAYYDAQIRYPERFVLALLADARQIAAERGVEFRLLTYHRARRTGKRVTIEPVAGSQAEPSAGAGEPLEIEPAALVNATGAWVDRTWQSLSVVAPRLIGGTKGSHFFTFHAPLRSSLAGRGLYAEAADGRPIFVTPLGDCTLVGTTDEPFNADPATAVAGDDELQYLLDAVNKLLPQVRLARRDIAFSYSGVRPLPYVHAASPAAITRRHGIERSDAGGLPCYAIVGGKLTTCRSLAEQAAERILGDLGLKPRANSRDRPLPGGENYPADAASLQATWDALGRQFRLPPAAVQAVWLLQGTRTEAVLAEAAGLGSFTPGGDPCLRGGLALVRPPEASAESAAALELVPDTALPAALVRWIIRHEWVTNLDDLVERRLMLLYDQRLSRRSLETLARLLAAENRISPDQIPLAVATTADRLANHFGKRLGD